MNLLRSFIAVLAAALCSWGIWQAGRIGCARTLVEYATIERRDDPTVFVAARAAIFDPKSAAMRAVLLSPSDAETHAGLGDILQRLEDYPLARDEFQSAVQLRPRDYYLWMLLGMTRDQDQDQEGALRALRQSTVLAPWYAPPRWQLGNLLLRMGQSDQAFVELRRAAESNPSLWPNVVDLAWGVYGHDPDAVVRAIQPNTDSARMSLALLFARHNQGGAALAQFRSTAVKSDKKTENLLDELLKARAFAEGYEVWAHLRGVPPADSGALRDGSFEGVLTVGQTGFGWQITPDLANVILSIDEAEHQGGARSLRIDFRGNSNPISSLVSQIILVKPLTRYHLGLSALSKEFVSAAPPVITLLDSSDPKKVVLAQSPSLLSDPGIWREFAIDFTTGADTRAITVILARQSCPNDPCPAFGTVWLDSVSLATR